MCIYIYIYTCLHDEAKGLRDLRPAFKSSMCKHMCVYAYCILLGFQKSMCKYMYVCILYTIGTIRANQLLVLLELYTISTVRAN